MPYLFRKKKIHIRVILSTILFFSAEQSQSFAQPTSLSLDDAIKKALAQSLDTKRAALKLAQAKISSDIINASNLPTLGITGAWGTRWQKRTDNSPPAFEEQSDIHSYSLQMRYNLLDFGRQNAKTLSATSQLKLQELAREEADEKIFWSVLRAYQDVAASERILEITKEQQSISENRLSEQTKNYRQGLRPESDVVTAEVDVGKAKIARQNAMNEVLLSKQALLQLIDPENANKNLDFSVARGSVSTGNPETWEALIQSIEKQSASLTTSIKIISASRDALKADEDAIDASTKPVIGALIAGEYSGEGDWSPMRPSASGQIQITWDVPWNGMSRLNRQSLILDRQDLDYKENDLKRSLEQREVLARTLVSQTKALYSSMQNQAELVAKQFKLVQNRYKLGQASALDLSAAENALVSMKLDQIKLSSNVVIAITNLAEARGVRSIEILSQL